MTTSPITLPVLLLSLLSLVLAFAAGAWASGILAAALLIAAGIVITLALFVHGAEAYGEGVMAGMEGEE